MVGAGERRKNENRKCREKKDGEERRESIGRGDFGLRGVSEKGGERQGRKGHEEEMEFERQGKGSKE